MPSRWSSQKPLPSPSLAAAPAMPAADSHAEDLQSSAANPWVRKLTKKLEQVRLLEAKQESGEALNEDQLAKLRNKESLQAELNKLLSVSGDASAAEEPVTPGEVDVVDGVLSTPRDILDYAINLDDASLKRFRRISKTFRELRDLRSKETLEPLQQKKLERLQEAAPTDLAQFRSLRDRIIEMKQSDEHEGETVRRRQLQREEARLERERAEREAQERAEEESLASREKAAAAAERHVRVGIDVGGVFSKFLNDKGSESTWHKSRDAMVPGVLRVLRRLVDKFGRENVFIVSKCSGIMRRQTEDWLLHAIGITSFLPRENIHFCRERFGANGKGPIAAALRLTHFIDDRPDCLWSIYFDEAGNSRSDIDSQGGKLYYFRRSGEAPQMCKALSRGNCKWGAECNYSHGAEASACYPHWPESLQMPPCVHRVDDWDHVERMLDDM